MSADPPVVPQAITSSDDILAMQVALFREEWRFDQMRQTLANALDRLKAAGIDDMPTASGAGLNSSDARTALSSVDALAAGLSASLEHLVTARRLACENLVRQMDFSRIPAGQFTMGSTKEQCTVQKGDGMTSDWTYSSSSVWSPGEMPPHQIYLDTYEIGKYPVTRAQFAAFSQATRYQHHPDALKDWPARPDYPVTAVSWHDAVAFCKWMSTVLGQEVGLPTEAQWEKAARGTDGRRFPWGESMPDPTRCNFDKQVGATTPVGRYSPTGDSPYGLADVAGNVWDWCADWYDKEYYKSSPSKSPTGPMSGSSRVVRGGSWHNNANNVRAAFRYYYSPDFRSYRVGLRVARSL